MFAISLAGFAHKICDSSGNWFRHPETNRTWTNYTTCIDVKDYEVKHREIQFPIVQTDTLSPSHVIVVVMFMLHVSAETTSESNLCDGLHHLVDSDPAIDFHILLLQVSFDYLTFISIDADDSNCQGICSHLCQNLISTLSCCL